MSETPGEFNQTIHLIYGLWDSGPLPSDYQRNITRWKQLHPDWKIKLWQPKQLRQVWRQHMPIPWQGAFSRPVQYADVCRCLILYHYGGVYADLDLEPLESMETIPRPPGDCCWVGMEYPVKIHYQKISDLDSDTSQHRVVLQDLRGPGIRPRSESRYNLPEIRQGIPERLPRLANFWMMATPKHPWFQQTIALQLARRFLRVTREYDVQYTTGPDVMSEILGRYRTEQWRDDWMEFVPLTGSPEPSLRVLSHAEMRRRFCHRCSGSWRWNKNKYIVVG